MKALLIGCGQIGAMYDFQNHEVLTHAKAYYQLGFNVDFIEPNGEIAHKVVTKYGFNQVSNHSKFRDTYDYISICTPTSWHAKYLKEAIVAQTPIIICEKPIAYLKDKLEVVHEVYKKGNSKVLVNYVRRFQKSYAWLKKKIELFNEPLQSFHCNYYKGLMNYAGHALDTVEYLTGFELENATIEEIRRKYDFFKEDPTITFFGKQNGVSFTFQGLYVDYPIFEIDLFYSNYRVSLTEGGSTARIFNKGHLILQKNELLKDYMIDVFEEANRLFKNPGRQDNFDTSIKLNSKLIDLINSDYER